MQNQLLYFWIRRTNYTCFENDEFNFSPSFSFHFDSNENLLTEEPLNRINIFQERMNLSNITAIVGSNGAGKTALLKAITQMTIKRKTVNSRLDDGNMENTSDYFIAVFYINNRFVVVNRHLHDITFSSGTKKENYLVPRDNDIPQDFSFIYFSLESKDTESFDLKNRINFIPLTPKQIKNDGNRFVTSKVIGDQKKELDFEKFDFEKFWDTYIYSKNKRIVDSNPIINVSINSRSLLKDAFYKNGYDTYISGAEKISESMHINELGLVGALSLDLCLEIKNGSYDKFMKDVRFTPETSGEECKSFFTEIMYSNDFDKETVAYIKKAVNEICLFDSLKKNRIVTYEDDPNFRHGIISYDMPIGELRKLFTQIFKKGPSFLFKYLSFNYGCSDGELAKIRQKAYLEYISKIEELFPDRYSLKNNIVVLMDEIDVHLHPNEQRKLISSIVDSIETFFNGKTVQILFTTHSPVVLSDLPSQNVLYIKKNEGTSKRIIKRKMDNRTFGANIYDLYNDSFFFEDQVLMGDYAKKYIDQLYNKIVNTDLERRSQYKEAVDLIGEQIVRNELNNVIDYGNNKPRMVNVQYNRDIIESLKEQRDSIDELIKKMEELAND